MTLFKTLVTTHKNQFKALAIVIVLVLGGVGLLSYSNSSFFQRFLGEVNPLLAISLSGVLGFLSLSFLLSKEWFTIHKKYPLKKVLPYTGLTLLFASVAILIDINIVYPADMNIPFPESLLFYPVIAFLVEIIFHVLPLTLLLIVATSVFRKSDCGKLVLPCILIVALFEPTYQIIFMDNYPIWATGAVWINLFLFNITQLFIFKKYGFLSMYVLRLVYYLFWHIIWGALRLELLFLIALDFQLDFFF
ncbi:hypothetical protein [Maribacter halichondriae]|uniref:hypothetical protein n=1 Tax=Maribacter halichondriae TaxID=2980554 RepID=UPI0023595E45|nr:hypothetical protein [Maribacter sp. Hal144]